MKLAEALSIRKDLQVRIAQLGPRIQANVKVQEGDEPSEQPEEMMKELDACYKQVEGLMWQINTTNMQTRNAEGTTLTQLLAQRDVLSMRICSIGGIINAATPSQNRYSRTEIKSVTIVDVKSLRKQIDAYSNQLRKLDMEIQTLNFQTELLEV